MRKHFYLKLFLWTTGLSVGFDFAQARRPKIVMRTATVRFVRIPGMRGEMEIRGAREEGGNTVVNKRLAGSISYFSTRWCPRTNTSIPLFENVFQALAGLATIGSPRRLKLVFINTGTPVASPNFSTSR